MTSGLPDWLRGYALLGLDPAENVVTIAVDADGNLNVLMRAENPSGDLVNVAVDASGQLYAIMRGASGNDVAVDADGNMSAVLKGDYAGALRTIGLDDDGRISAYIYDSIDAWGQIASVGFAELAARLGSVVRYERSGQIHWIESFEAGLQRWEETLSGANASVKLSPVFSHTGGYSCELIGGSDGGRTAFITCLTGVNPVGKLGLSFAFASESDYEWIKLNFYLRTTGYQYQPILWMCPPLSKIYIDDSASVWQEVCDFDKATLTGKTWNTIKLIVDFDNILYGTVRFNAGSYDMSAHGFTVASGSYVPEVSVRIEAKSRLAQNDKIYIDDVILTFAEP